MLIFYLVSFNTFSNEEENTFYFSNLKQEDGLPSNMVNTIVQDSLGFIWIGTNNGLSRFDGYATITFKEQTKPNSLPNSNIRSLLMDGDEIWIGTWKGLCTINAKTFEIIPYNIGANTSIRSLYKSKDGRIWIGTSNGLIIYDRSLNKYEYFSSNNSALSHSTIRCFYESSDGSMWIGTYNKLNRFKNGQFETFDLKGNYKPYLQNNLILDIKPLNEGNDSTLLIGTETGLVVFDRETYQHRIFNSSNTNISNEVIKCIHNEKNELWLGTDFGLTVLDSTYQTSNTLFHNPILNHSIANNVIWKIFKDRNNTVWLLTSNGISLINTENTLYEVHEELYTIKEQKAGNQIRDILITKDNTMYMATIHGVIQKNLSTGKKTYFRANLDTHRKLLLDNTFALTEGPNGKIWIGTAGGINIWDPKSHSMKALSSNKTNGLTSNYVGCFACTSNGEMWVAAWEGGIFKITGDLNTPESLRFINVEKESPDYIYACGNNIYYYQSNQLFCIDSKTLEKQSIEEVNNTLINQEISCINTSNDTIVWIASSKQLIEYHPKDNSLISSPINNPIINQTISLVKDHNHNIWMASLNAVIKYDLASKKAVSMPLNPNYLLKSFYNNCSATSPTGTVYFGGDNGYIESTPFSNDHTISSPETVLSEISINNTLINISEDNYFTEDIAYLNNLELNHNQNSLTFFFSTLNFWQPHRSHFRYRLLNFDNNWNSSLNANFATYSNLRPGSYTLELESYNYAGIKCNQIKQLHINILPPLWLSKPFILLYFLIVIAIVLAVLKILEIRHKLYTEIRLSHLENKHTEELFNTKQQFFTHISHELRTPLSLINPPIKQVINSNTLTPKNLEMLRLAEKNSKRLLNLVNQILDFRKLETQTLPLIKTNVDIIRLTKEVFDSFNDMASRNEIQYKFISDVPHFVTYIDREKIEAILFNILTNAFKHTRLEGSISIIIETVAKNNDNFKITISDTGVGIAQNEINRIFESFYQSKQVDKPGNGTGIGLSMAKQYAELHNGTINVASNLGHGSTFTLIIPIEKNELLPEPTPDVDKSSVYFEEPKVITNSNNKKVLIIDDNPDILDYIEMNINSDYQISRAINGQDGFEKAFTNKPDLIICDIMMPVMDGIELCKKIKSHNNFQHIPVILLTAKSLDVQKTEGINSGANMYITKPFDISYLKACIYNLMQTEVRLHQYIKTQLLISPTNTPKVENNQDEQFLKKVMEIIAGNVSNPNLTVDLISSEIGLSSTHLYRKIKAITDQSTKDIIKNYRLNQAAQMIKNNEGNLTDITYSVGFGSLSSFSKSFKSVFGVSPSEYKETKITEAPYSQQ